MPCWMPEGSWVNRATAVSLTQTKGILETILLDHTVVESCALYHLKMLCYSWINSTMTTVGLRMKEFDWIQVLQKVLTINTHSLHTFAALPAQWTHNERLGQWRLRVFSKVNRLDNVKFWRFVLIHTCYLLHSHVQTLLFILRFHLLCAFTERYILYLLPLPSASPLDLSMKSRICCTSVVMIFIGALSGTFPECHENIYRKQM